MFKSKIAQKKYQAKYIREHYKKNKKYYADKRDKYRLRLYEEVIVVAKNKPCVDCKHVFAIVCMDFDHVRGNKLFNISTAYANVPLKVLLEEIAKCDVVCANCHRVRTASRI